MTPKTLTLPFITKTPDGREDLSYSAELAYAACLAEEQRKKPSFLRETAEKTAFIAKVYYPLQVFAAENACVLIDGLSSFIHEFAFEEPAKTAEFIEELKKASPNPQNFLEALKTQAKIAKDFSATAKHGFPALIDDRELLDFLAEYFKSGALQDGNQQETAVIPAETDPTTAAQTAHLSADNASRR
jgi:hypothetical protein